MSAGPKHAKPYDPATDPDAAIEVTNSFGRVVAADRDELWTQPGLSAAARGVALLARVHYDPPTAEQIAELTGDPVGKVKGYMRELSGSGYLDWEG